ncbi:hypothetical protein JCM10908_006028 [Rhodotorula pacifica]|uniref:uncharacterized protein n=1 Tax=Rhodotorula pacifica TaxID=1495444 RepID=UPI00316F5942
MLGSPPSAAAALPSFSFLDDDSSHRAASDTDFLPAWSKTLSPSPGLAATLPDLSTTATASSSHGTGNGSVPATGLASTSASVASTSRSGSSARRAGGKGADPVKGKGKGKAAAPDVGTGLSPVLAPTHIGPSTLALDSTDPNLADAVFSSAHSPSAFEASFGNTATRKSPIMRRKNLSQAGEPAPAPLSMANVATLPSVPTSGPPSASTRRASTSVTRNPSRRQSMTEEVAGQRAFAQGLPDGLQRRSTATSLNGAEEAPRIQAYAKLEFPSFDIYIQKLSVTIGRRPASALASLPSPSVPLSLDDARDAGVSLEDYILGLSDNPTIKKEESLTPHELNGLSPKELDKGKGKAREIDPFAEFVRGTSPNDGQKPAIDTKPAPAPSVAPQPAAAPLATLTDVDLGPLRAVSRQHAKLFFDYEIGAWVLEVLGRNGVVVEGNWRAKGQKAVLTKKTKIQIAERIFHFVLPTIDVVTIGADADAPTASTSTSAAPPVKRQESTGARSTSQRVGEDGEADGAASSSSLSEVSDSDTEVTAVRAKSGQQKKAALRDPSDTPAPPALPKKQPLASIVPPTTINPEALTGPMPSTSSAPSAPTPRKAPPSIPTAASYRPVRASAKRQASPPPSTKPAITAGASSTAEGEADLQDAHSRAEMVAQILSGRMPAGTGRDTLVKAAAEAQRRAGKGKGKAPVRPTGKAPGKGKGLPPRSRRPSDASQWSEQEEAEEEGMESSDSDSDSSGDSDIDEDLVQAATEVMDMDVVKNRFGGGKMLAVRNSPRASPAPSYMPAKTPRHAGKVPAKQPRQRPNPTPAAAPSPAKPTPAALPPANFPPIPSSLPSILPALPTFAISPAPGTPALLPPSALPSLPPLPPLKPATPSPAASTGALPGLSTAATSGKAAGATVPAKKPKSHKKKVKTEIVGAAPTAGTLKPPGIVPGATSPAGSAAAVSNGGDLQPGQSDAATAAGATEDKAKETKDGKDKGKGDAPAKPRPSPYTPAPLPEDGVMPDAAPADNPNAKPPYTYASLIAQAINGSDSKKMSLHEIYDWVKDKWPFFSLNQSGWQNSIRHNLTPARGFLKVLRKDDEPGKGSFWEIDPAQMSNFDGHHFRKKADGPTGGSSSNKAKAAAAAAAAAASSAGGATPAPAPPTNGTTAAPAPPQYAGKKPKSHAIPQAAASAPASTPAPSPAARPPPPSATSSSSSHNRNGPPGPGHLSKPLPLVIGPIPDSYVRPPPPPTPNGQPPDELTAQLLADPPIVMHEGQLILNPTIFASLPKETLDALQKEPAGRALQTLQAHVVQHLKERLRKKGMPKPSRPSPAAPATASTSKHSGGGTKRARESDAGGGAGIAGIAPGTIDPQAMLKAAPPAKSAKHKKGSHATSAASVKH